MRIVTFSFLLRAGLALVVLAAGLAVLTGFDRMGHRLEVLGAATWTRFPIGLAQIAAAVLLMTPRRLGYGAALALGAGLAATLAHLTVLGWDSAPPAMLITAVSGLLLWQNRDDLKH